MGGQAGMVKSPAVGIILLVSVILAEQAAGSIEYKSFMSVVWEPAGGLGNKPGSNGLQIQ